jgi:hypothetical protein
MRKTLMHHGLAEVRVPSNLIVPNLNVAENTDEHYILPKMVSVPIYIDPAGRMAVG